MKKIKTIFICQECGFQTSKWLGRCPECQAWSTFAEEQAAPAGGQGRTSHPCAPVPIAAALHRSAGDARLTTGIGELDRVLGGGIVAGSLVLIGGDPGIGKSTLLLQLLDRLTSAERQVLYVSGEESIDQIAIRGRRLHVTSEQLLVVSESSLEAVLALASTLRPHVLAIDSIQTLRSEEYPSAPGSITQVRESTARLLTFAKQEQIPVILVGHVTKDGAIAGPKVLEHMVDTVLYFEGDRGQIYRILRTVKNRFGSTNEIGVFEMKDEGLLEVENPSEIFLAERPQNEPGSVVLPSMEGTRPILVEVQALVTPSNLGMPRRTANGADQQRLALLTAVLEKKAGLALYSYDIFLNIAGGLRVDEPALDLGVICAIASSLLERPISPNTAVCGEIGLAGEVRGVSQMELRIREAHRLGFTRMLLPKRSVQRLSSWPATIELVGVESVADVLARLF